ncbi:MAG: hypothetical protein JNJ86_01170 [Chitinophagaceae bacterium]|nr:hypothetical protein [Chitinophagaceae bacterium]
MRKKIIAITLAFLPIIAKAQVVVNVQLPAGGMVQKDQLWNLVVVNNVAEVNEATISLDLQDAVTGQTVLSAGSRTFVLSKGVKVFNIKDVQPVQYNFLSSELNGNYIPLGSYVAFYRVIKKTLKGQEPLGDECVRVSVNPLSPPLLNTPFDRAILQTNYPQFSWLPPAPTEMFSDLNYELVVTEIMPGQSPTEAVLYNTPVYANHNLARPFEILPSSFSVLKTGQPYAWRVTARNGFNYAAQTEVWSFVIEKPVVTDPGTAGSSYLLLKNSNDNPGTGIVEEKELLIKYYSFDKEHEAAVKIFTVDGQKVQVVKQKILYGDNFLRLQLNHQFESGKTYQVEITDMQKNKYTTRFSIK